MAIERPVEIRGLIDCSPIIFGKCIGTKRYRNPRNGKEYEYSLFYGTQRWGVMVIPFTDQNELIVVAQFRHGGNDIFYEFPGGGPDNPSENPAEVAARELQEETGFTTADITLLADSLCIDAANYLGRIRPFVARNCKLTHHQKLDATEHQVEYIEVHCFSFQHWLNLIDTGRIIDAKTLAMTFLWMRRQHM